MSPVALAQSYVAAPAFAPLPYGLLSVAQPVDDPDAHWRAGIQYQPDPCDPATALLAGCPTTSDTATKTATSTGLGTRGAEAVTVMAWVDCGPVGLWDEAGARARQALLNGEGRALERAFWTGDVEGAAAALNPHLAEDAAVVDGSVTIQTAATNVATGAPANGVPHAEAIGLLEGALAACYGGVGVIHMPRWTLATFAGPNRQVERDGSRLRTHGGTWVAAGAGYVGIGPDGSTPPAGSAWLYATGAVFVRRGDVVVPDGPQSLDRAENRLVMVAERTYVVGWDCCHFAVLADVGGFTPPLVAAP